jgi:hypothetical protein
LSLASYTFLNRLPEEVFDLAVDTTQFVLRPGFQFSPELGINTKQKGFSLHGPDLSVVERAGVQHRMSLGFTAEHNHEIADHGSLALVVKH